MEKSKSFSGSYQDVRAGFEDRPTSYSFNGPNREGDDVLASNGGNPEVKRRKRVASYNMFTVEAKLKS